MAVAFRTEGRVGIITIERPEARNAVNAEVAAGIEAAIDRLDADDELWCGILTGAGGVFCAGADLKEIAAGGGAGLVTERGGFGGFVLRERSTPVIAAVEGPAVAGGTELALACDLVVASTEAVFGLPEVARSLVALGGGLARLPGIIGTKLAMEIALTGDSYPAAWCHERGLVNRLSEPGRALDEALVLAERICANAPIAVQETRRVLLAGLHLEVGDAIAAATDSMARVARTDDMAEGPRAFIEKRPPRWTGR